jgi:hypothetical protein
MGTYRQGNVDDWVLPKLGVEIRIMDNRKIAIDEQRFVRCHQGRFCLPAEGPKDVRLLLEKSGSLAG